MVRGSGFTILQMGSVVLSPPLDSSSMASVLKITLKCVLSEGVMVNVFGSDLSFLLTWMQQRTAQDEILTKSLNMYAWGYELDLQFNPPLSHKV